MSKLTSGLRVAVSNRQPAPAVDRAAVALDYTGNLSGAIAGHPEPGNRVSFIQVELIVASWWELLSRQISGPSSLPAPEKTLQAFAEHGVLKGARVADGGDAEAMLARIAQAGVDIDALAIQLQRLADKSAAQVR